MWPGLRRGRRAASRGSTATWIVRARSAAEMPVVTPLRASTETVKAVPKRAELLWLVIGRQVELVAALRRRARRQIRPRPLRGHEVDRLGRDVLGGHDEVALVLAVLVVADDDHAPRRGCRRWLPRWWRTAELAGASLVLGRSTVAERVGPLLIRTPLPQLLAGEPLGGPGSGDDSACTYLRDHVGFEVDLVARAQVAPASSPRRCAGSATTREAVVRRGRAIVRLTPSTATEPCGTLTSTTSAAPSSVTTRRCRSRRASASTVPTPSTCPVTMCPPRRDRSVSARSRLSRSPGRLRRQRRAPHRLGHGVGAEARRRAAASR